MRPIRIHIDTSDPIRHVYSRYINGKKKVIFRINDPAVEDDTVTAKLVRLSKATGRPIETYGAAVPDLWYRLKDLNILAGYIVKIR